jgi:peroxiredoxin
MKGGKAPEFELPSLAGGPISLTDLLASGPVLLVFYKVTCPTCQLTLPFLERLHRGRRADAPQVVAISQDDHRATGEFNRRFGITFTTLLDPHERPHEQDVERYPASNAYRIENVPTLFLVEQGGTVSQSVVAFDKAELEGLGRRFGVEIFTPADRVPVFQPG